MTDEPLPAPAPLPSIACDVEVVHAATVNFAMEQCGVPIVAAVNVVNRGSEALRDAVLEVGLGPDLGELRRIELPPLAPGESFAHGPVDLRPPFPRLRAVVEAEPAELRYSVVAAGRALASETLPLRLLAFNEWPGDAAPLELLAAFVTPNQPAIATVLDGVRAWLAENSSDDAIHGYQARSPQRARLEVEALYAALQRLGLSYVGVPASFERSGQKVRLPDQLVRERMGNCLDLTLLAAACLEQMGYAPLLVVVSGHALPGVWLIDERFADGAVCDPARVRNQLALGNVLAFDLTVAVSGQRPPLPSAIARANEVLADDAAFHGVVDVRVARRARFLPLPIVLRDAVAPAAAAHEVPRSAPITPATPAPVSGDAIADPALASPSAANDPVSQRIRRWKERLLDLTLRNKLLAMKRDRNVIRVEVPDLAAFESRVAKDEEFEILPYPKLGRADPRADELVEKRIDLEAELAQRRSDLARGKLHATLTVEELFPLAKKLFRQARTDLEEGGANTLYLVFGVLKWFESAQANEPRYAPLILMPAQLGYEPRLQRIRVRRTEEDPVGNVTLAEKLRRDFALDLGFLADPPLDDSGVDLAALFAAVRAAVQNMPRFEVLEETCIAQFTFGKFLMWRDLEWNAETLLRNDLVRHIAEGGARPWADHQPPLRDDELDRTLPPGELPTVVDADSTQLAAVLAAVRGRTFVLQGPPGTGKSQTITNLIAATLAAGKSVLFVAEKMAALDVVHRRLREVGLDDFCLELHSNKASKRQVLESLGRAANRQAAEPSSSFAATAARVAAARERLNDYVRALHEVRPLGISFRAASSRALELARLGAPIVELTLERGKETQAEELAGMCTAAADLASRAERVEPVAAHPWADSTLAEWSGERESTIRAGLDDAAAKEAQLRTVVRAFETASGTSGLTSLPEVEALGELVALSVGDGSLALPRVAMDEAALAGLATRVESLAAELATDEAERAEIARRWRGSLFDLGDELAVLRGAFEKHASSGGVLSRVVGFFALRGPEKRLAPHAVEGLPDATLVLSDLGRVLACRERAASLGAKARELVEAVAPAVVAPNADSAMWRSFRSRVAEAVRARAASTALGTVAATAAARVMEHATASTPAAAATRRALAKAAADLRNGVESLRTAAHGVERAAALRAPLELLTFDGVAAAFSARRTALPRLREWCAYLKAENAARDRRLGPVIDRLRDGSLARGVLAATTERSILEKVVALIRDADPILREFDGTEHSRRVDDFKTADRTLVATARLEVAAQLDTRRPSTGVVHDESEPGVLQRELKKKARHMPLRRLFQRIPNLVQRIKPCFLMSPLSVAQYLPPEGRKFDLVVFDEASQIGTHDAIGSIARGGQAVIVGDSRQLPPTAFFQRTDDGEESTVVDEYVEELESVLDEAVAARFPERFLRWHYRSRHESLIRFSNAHYYEDRLAVFPAARGRVADLGVKWRPVSDGVYEFGSSRTNPIEARALVDWLVAELRATPRGTRSFGVVTFSQPQQILVLDLLDEARVRFPEIEPHFDPASDEPVFVKNLENVQGDERDEILFSVCYGKAADGKIRMNFGPLNQAGGERRLNVAITRARRALRVFSTLTHDQIDVRRTTARGVHHLREFLRFAATESAAAAMDRPGTGEHSSEFERAVGAALVALGFGVDSQVGCGRYRIDLAVRHPTRPGIHVLGVELDGDAYRSGATARDRDRLRPQVLANLGWTLHRIWATDWWFDREREVERLAAAVRAAIANSERADAEAASHPSATKRPDAVSSAASAASASEEPAPDVPSASPKPGAESVVTEPPAEDAMPPLLEPYRHAELGILESDPERLFEPGSAISIERAVLEVVAVESPILRDSVVRDVARAFSISRLRERVRAPIERAIAELAATGRIALRDDFVWRAGEEPAKLAIARGADHAGEWRGLDEIATEELGVAAARILERALSLPRRELIRATARAFGISRLSKDGEARLEAAIDGLIAHGGARHAGEGDGERIESSAR